ncbi:MAG TPA: anaerobic ribonucleoside-triphosphate reductase activating protein [Ruminococcaceae bacterium]|nr:anaerobic ribonucleoside-triphosphate reductase activating protein [Oscillospiraceae bacterium]
MPQTVRLAGTVPESVVDGPGFRFVVFAQGCPHRCPGCHNPATHDFEGGFVAVPEDIIAQAKKNPLLKGVTLSGGEPFAQAEGFAEIARLAREAGLDVITYTGYTFEELLKGDIPGAHGLLGFTDILVDGRFEIENKSPLLKFRGSSNQRVLDTAASLAAGKAVTCEF